MKMILLFAAATALAGCTAEPATVPEPTLPQAAEAAPLSSADLPLVIGYGATAVITCAAESTVQQLRTMGKDEQSPFSGSQHTDDDFKRAHSALSGHTSAQEALKDLRTAESLCLRDATPAREQAVRDAAAAFDVEIEVIPRT